jgi:hypothetical protein
MKSPKMYLSTRVGLRRISVVPGGGVIAINASVQPSQTSVALTITHPLTIISLNGPSIIGN